jgi:small-conductance mechanosensitive channel
MVQLDGIEQMWKAPGHRSARGFHLRNHRHALRVSIWRNALLASCLSVLSSWLAAQPLDLSTPANATTTATAPAPETLYLNNRRIATFRATLLGDSPTERVQRAEAALATALSQPGPQTVSQTDTGDSVRFEVAGSTVFFLTAGDSDDPRPGASLPSLSRDVLWRLQTAVTEAAEVRDPRRIALGAALSLAASIAAWLAAQWVFQLRRRMARRIYSALQAPAASGAAPGLVTTYVEHARVVTRLAMGAVTWLLVLLIAEAWVSFVLHQFAWTRPWGERSTAWLLDVLRQFAGSMASAVPGLVVAALIFVIARMVSRANAAFLRRVESGDITLAWLDVDTASPTRRLSNFVIWLFALAMAYPYLPGANTEAFKALSVMAGLMLSLGASSVVGQALSGLSLMYSRSLRVGEYVKIGDTEGTVTSLGMFTTKVHTGMGEEVSLPNTVTFSQPIRNFSRLVEDGQFMLQTAVTIGYSTPWRQVHAMLLEAANRTPGVATEPRPYVVQTALSDFYVEYKLCAQSNKNAPRRRAEALNQLHANILDVFNENAVQIMSPHYMADPAAPQVVPPGAWTSPLPGQPLSPATAPAVHAAKPGHEAL